MRIEVGQKFDFEIDREDVEDEDCDTIIATWYHDGNPIFVELYPTKSLLSELRKFFNTTSERTALISITRVSKLKYIVKPTVVVLNHRANKLNELR
ncbi:MAG: hypothetical protein M1477_03975 [Candidatus Thermoplasmatota archaeon]|nr:hypothetical protein [Candidatus Thermoplasmatota archaeon]MCL5989591.1 hypothetical protein [Candidatus Thermoplasmatota archaeon]